MKLYPFKLSKGAIIGCIAGIVLGLAGIGFTLFRIIVLELGFENANTLIQHIVTIVASLLAITIFSSILLRSTYKLTDSELILWFGFIKSSYKLQDMESIHLFTKSNKLVIYFKDEHYTVIVVKPEWFNEFTKDICSRNPKIRYDVSTAEIDDSNI